MSPWQTESLLVELAPDQVNLLHGEHRLALRGLRTTTVNEWLAAAAAGPAAGPEAAPWQGAVQALAAALPAHAGRSVRGRVVLSNRLVRYALVPWSDALAGADEEIAFARHGFERVYGDAAAKWDLRVSDARDGAPKLASAVDAALPDALRETFAAAGVRLDSIQPQLMAVCNDYRRRLRGRHAWLALLEPGHLVLALADRGNWARVRSLRIGPGWRVELARILEREAYLADPEAAARDVFLWASGMDDVKLPENDRWQFHLLAHAASRGSAPSTAALAMAEGG